ncbi:MAG: M20/M25/M40 family metallo-hydrolase [Planctomycetes bacterium]|nr:M20/M25/M40 family metallo-hydrolase [Planctomycetota bacterium]
MPMPLRARDADPIYLLKGMIESESVNLGPEFADRVNPERTVVAFLEPILKRAGFEVRKQKVRAGRVNLVARLRGRKSSHPVMFEGHMDTVGVDGMTVPPFRLTKRGGRLYGRGTADTKGPTVSYLGGIFQALRDGVRPARDIVFVGAMGEETGCEGSRHLARSGFHASSGLVAEATRLNLCVAHKCALWWRVAVKGKTAHGSTPHLGVSAIEGAAAAVLALKMHGGRLAKRGRTELLSAPTLHVGCIRGGEKVNVVPARAEFDVDSRLHPDEDVKAYLRRANALLRGTRLPGGKAVDAKVVAHEHFLGFGADPDAPFLKLLGEIAREVTRGCGGHVKGGAFFSDAGPLAKRVRELAVFGPGDIAQAHTPDEYIDAAQLEAGTQIVRKLVAAL